MLPYRGRFGDPRPVQLVELALPPGKMPGRQGLRALKQWRYVGVYGSELMLCVGAVRIGPARQSFWAVWDRATGVMHERTRLGRGAVHLERGRVRVLTSELELDLRLDETAGVETICPSGGSYAWTRKQGGVRARGRILVGGRTRAIDSRAVIDDTAGYYQRLTSWRWSAGVGADHDGRELAWNLVSGINDPPLASERTVWIEEDPVEPPPCTFAADLGGVDGLRFQAEAVRERHENLLLVRSSYRQPFGTFSGELPGGVALQHGYGVMEAHDVRW